MGRRRAVAAAVGVLLLAGCAGSPTPDTASVGSSTAPVPAGLEAGCPPEDTPLRLATGDLPGGAVGVRLCPGAPLVADDGTRHGPFVQPVADELTTGVEPLVDLVNGLPSYEPGDCPLDGGPEIVYWFRYPDGDARAVAYGEHGCHTLTVGEELQREDGPRLAQAFADALAAQRAATRPPSAARSATRPDCPPPTGEGPTSVLPQVPLRLVRATWCQGTGPGRGRTAPVPRQLLRRLNEGLLGKPARGRDRCPSVGYWQSIEGIDRWGDRVSYWVLSDCRVHTRVGYGRETATATFAAAPDLVVALRALPATEVRW